MVGSGRWKDSSEIIDQVDGYLIQDVNQAAEKTLYRIKMKLNRWVNEAENT